MIESGEMSPRLEKMVGAALFALAAGSVASAIGYFAFLTLLTRPRVTQYEFSDSTPGFRVVQILIDRGLVGGIFFGIVVASLVFWILNRGSLHRPPS